MPSGEQTERLAWFKGRVDALAAVIEAPAGSLPTYGRSDDGARPHIEYANGKFHFVVVERGQELDRVSSHDPDEIVYRVMQCVTSEMATAHELRHRRRGEDPRRIMFATQLELLGRLSESWRAREAARQAEILGRHPFRDEWF